MIYWTSKDPDNEKGVAHNYWKFLNEISPIRHKTLDMLHIDYYLYSKVTISLSDKYEDAICFHLVDFSGFKYQYCVRLGHKDDDKRDY